MKTLQLPVEVGYTGISLVIFLFCHLTHMPYVHVCMHNTQGQRQHMKSGEAKNGNIASAWELAMLVAMLGIDHEEYREINGWCHNIERLYS